MKRYCDRHQEARNQRLTGVLYSRQISIIKVIKCFNIWDIVQVYDYCPTLFLKHIFLGSWKGVRSYGKNERFLYLTGDPRRRRLHQPFNIMMYLFMIDTFDYIDAHKWLEMFSINHNQEIIYLYTSQQHSGNWDFLKLYDNICTWLPIENGLKYLYVIVEPR